jgi:hypothetical protein
LLSHCHDFTVVDPRGGTGFVSDLRFLSRVDQPDEIEVTTGGSLRSRVTWVPVSQVEHVSSERREIVLSTELPWSRHVHGARTLLSRARELTL